VTAILFDTLRLARTLREKGRFAPEQAEALAEALGDATHEDLVTKADLAVLKADLAEVKAGLTAEITIVRAAIGNLATKAEIAEVKSEIAEVKAEIAGVKADILKWVVGAIGFQTVAMLGALITLVKIFAK